MISKGIPARSSAPTESSKASSAALIPAVFGRNAPTFLMKSPDDDRRSRSPRSFSRLFTGADARQLVAILLVDET